MMLVLQRINADHRLTYGELSVLNMAFVTLEPSVGYRKSLPRRIPAGTYVLTVTEDGALLVEDVPGYQDVRIATGNSITQTTQNILVGLNRAAHGMVEYTEEAFGYIADLVRERFAAGEECFIDVRDGV